MYCSLNVRSKKPRPFSGFSFRKPVSQEKLEPLQLLERDPRDVMEGFAFEFPLLCAKLGASIIPQVMVIDPETNEPVSPLTKLEEYEVKPYNDRSRTSTSNKLSQLSTSIRTSQISEVPRAKCLSPIPYVIAYFDDDQKQVNLRKLIFKGFNIDDEMMKALGTIMIWYNTLETLHLQQVGFTAKLLKNFALYLNDSSYHIINLNLDENPIPEQNYNVLLKQPGLQHLSLRKCGITDLGAQGIAEELKFKDPPECQTLKHLDLSDNQIGDEGTGYLAESLRTNRTLEEIVLSKNIIGDKGAIELASVGMKFPLNTQELNIRKLRGIERTRKSVYLAQEKLQSLIESRETRSAGPRRSRKGRASFAVVSNEDRNQIHREVVQEMSYDTHPYTWDARPEDLDMWCIGNFHLKEINLADNKIGVRGAQKMLETLQYQHLMRHKENKQETGLRNTVLQGNISPDKCPALAKIQELLTVDLREKHPPKEHRDKLASILCPKHIKSPATLTDRESCVKCSILRDSRDISADEIVKKEEKPQQVNKKLMKSAPNVSSPTGKKDAKVNANIRRKSRRSRVSIDNELH